MVHEFKKIVNIINKFISIKGIYELESKTFLSLRKLVARWKKLTPQNSFMIFQVDFTTWISSDQENSDMEKTNNITSALWQGTLTEFKLSKTISVYEIETIYNKVAEIAKKVHKNLHKYCSKRLNTSQNIKYNNCLSCNLPYNNYVTYVLVPNYSYIMVPQLPQ
ncbi:26354_t:CDS:1, partial [Dentiscutata erythropus]